MVRLASPFDRLRVITRSPSLRVIKEKFDFYPVWMYPPAMKGERIVYANDTEIAQEGIRAVVEKYASKAGHELVGTASSVDELQSLLEGGLNPTVFLFNPRFPTLEDGKKAVEIVRKLSPGTLIVALPSFEGVEIADYGLRGGIGVGELVAFLTNLQH